ncbi:MULTISPECIES: hypothetical protein [unclassified Sphingobacterium]|uniref:hypothetical protein n=1 Tax=unclassified Sphingobacterium TaxID=2609468 RepID=UPI00104C98BA|nr:MULTISPECIES: hypothetical protein [unclassified Sphingobacterium]MCS3556927.1 hypothetical protein [Sphingobacterium sp. JUb21]TCQ98931.1 hypothetical protein EDF66_11641 [Sphingobacterium sp. JUb20]
MSYLEFNKWVYDYYRTTTLKNGFCSLAIDEYEIEIFKKKYSLENLHFREIRLAPWSKLLQPYSYNGLKIPAYFGLIALQCLGASSMENYEEISVTNYSKRFCNVVGVKKKQLEELFSELFAGEHVQELLWNRAKNYLRDNLGFHLSIPNNTKGPGRYNQFPRSQVVLNKEDLKEIADKVLINLDIEKVISEKEFNGIFYRKFLAQTFSRKNNKSKHETTTRDLFFKQVFNYYNSGEWDSIANKKETSKRNRKTTYFIEFGLEDSIHFYRHMTEVHQLYEIFKGDDVYIYERVAGSVEFEQSNLFSLNTELILVSRRRLEIGTNINHKHSGFNIIRCFFTIDDYIPEFLRNKLRNTKDEIPVYLKGVRLGHTWNYVQNFGPEIIGENYSVLYTDFDHPKEQVILEDYNSLECQPGLYNVKVAGHTSLRFVVLDHKDNANVDEVDSGLRLNSFTIDTTGTLLKGLRLYGSLRDTINKEMNINQWSKACTGQDFLSANNLLKSIKYQHYD